MVIIEKAARKRQAWSEIEVLYQSEWVQLLDYDWPKDSSRPVAGVVAAYATSKDELLEHSVSCLGHRNRIVCVADPKQHVEIIFWANLHQWQNPELFGLHKRKFSELIPVRKQKNKNKS